MESCNVLVLAPRFGVCLTLSIIHIPDSLQMHGSYFYHMTDFFTLENSITATAGHAGNI
jgi:hypothetical protein